jgi:hypothetical protein
MSAHLAVLAGSLFNCGIFRSCRSSLPELNRAQYPAQFFSVVGGRACTPKTARFGYAGEVIIRPANRSIPGGNNRPADDDEH